MLWGAAAPFKTPILRNDNILERRVAPLPPFMYVLVQM